MPDKTPDRTLKTPPETPPHGANGEPDDAELDQQTLRAGVDAHVDRVRKTLRDRLRRSEISQRKVEDRCGWARGYLSQVLHGRITLGMHHIFSVLTALGQEPEEFFAALYSTPPELSRDEIRERMAAYDAALEELRVKGILSGSISWVQNPGTGQVPGTSGPDDV